MGLFDSVGSFLDDIGGFVSDAASLAGTVESFGIGGGGGATPGIVPGNIAGSLGPGGAELPPGFDLQGFLAGGGKVVVKNGKTVLKPGGASGMEKEEIAPQILIGLAVVAVVLLLRKG